MDVPIDDAFTECVAHKHAACGQVRSMRAMSDKLKAYRPFQKMYSKQRWTNRAKQQLHIHPLCKMCLDVGYVREANVADHVIPHHGDHSLFWFGDLQSLCWDHHNSSKKQIENKGYVNDIGVDGWPIDPKHPVFKASKS